MTDVNTNADAEPLDLDPDEGANIEGLDVIEDLFGEDDGSSDADGTEPSVQGADTAPAAEGEAAGDEPAVVPEGETPPTEEAPSADPQPAEPTPTETPAEPAPTKEPAAAEEATQQPPADTQQPVSELSAEQLQEQFKTNRETAINELATGYERQLLDDEHLDIEPDAVKGISRLMSQVYIDAVSTTMVKVAEILPAAIAQANERTTQYNAAEEEFFQAWPKLKDHRDTVVQLAQVYRAQNPQASREEFNKNVGAMAHVSLQIPIEEAPPPTPAPEPAPRPFTPAQGGAPGGAKPPTPSNPFEALTVEALSTNS